MLSWQFDVSRRQPVPAPSHWFRGARWECRASVKPRRRISVSLTPLSTAVVCQMSLDLSCQVMVDLGPRKLKAPSAAGRL